MAFCTNMPTGSEVPRHFRTTYQSGQSAWEACWWKRQGDSCSHLHPPCQGWLRGLSRGSTHTLAAVLSPILPSQTYQFLGSQDQLRDPSRGGTLGTLQVETLCNNASHLEISDGKAVIQRNSLLGFLRPTNLNVAGLNCCGRLIFRMSCRALGDEFQPLNH